MFLNYYKSTLSILFAKELCKGAEGTGLFAQKKIKMLKRENLN
jgi:hypothetical protein